MRGLLKGKVFYMHLALSSKDLHCASLFIFQTLDTAYPVAAIIAKSEIEALWLVIFLSTK
ncbi:hypothetical protein [Microbulbifer sp. JMSA002]|uniref:hypothetical protein n=1 Tax=Microbulbifer sp. JMSA002 TaxID=3243368 RepID=UPI004039206B